MEKKIVKIREVWEGLRTNDLKKLGILISFSVSDVAEWIGDQWRDLGPAALGLDPSDLERINLDSLEEMLHEFGTFNFTKSQANALIKAAKKAWDESGKT